MWNKLKPFKVFIKEGNKKPDQQYSLTSKHKIHKEITKSPTVREPSEPWFPGIQVQISGPS